MNNLEIVDAGRYENVFIGETMVASYDEETGEFVVYNPYNDSDDPEYIIDDPREVVDDA